MSRCLVFSPPESTRSFPNDVSEAGGLALKNRLVAMRARNMGVPLPAVQKRYGGRFGDITRPLLQVITLICPTALGHLHRALDQLHFEVTRNRSDSLNARVVRGLHSAVANGASEVELLDVSVIINEEFEDDQQLGPKVVARTIRALGFSTGKSKDRRRRCVIQVDHDLLDVLISRYSPHDSYREAPLSSDAPAPARSQGERAEAATEGMTVKDPVADSDPERRPEERSEAELQRDTRLCPADVPQPDPHHRSAR